MRVSRSRDDATRLLLERLDMNALLARRPEALAEMAQALSAPLYRFVSRLVGQEADAEDVVQQTFASAMGKLGEFRGSADDLRSWIFTIAYRAAMDVLRGRRRAVPLEPDAVVVDEPVDLETAPADLRRAFATLSPAQQSLLTLKYQDGFSNPEIAEILGVTPNHAGVLLFRAKQTLRKAMK
jgi:RNA polymerase sigma-70 factor (ECF subfamily)